MKTSLWQIVIVTGKLDPQPKKHIQFDLISWAKGKAV